MDVVICLVTVIFTGLFIVFFLSAVLLTWHKWEQEERDRRNLEKRKRESLKWWKK
jgi:hypothetical protein